METQENKTTQKKSNKMKVIIAAGLTLAVIGTGFFMVKQKNETELVKSEAALEREKMQANYLSSFEMIENNLMEISAHEDVLRNNFLLDKETGTASVEDRVQQEISIIEQLIANNNATIAELESKLGANDNKLAEYNKKNSRLKRKLSKFTAEIEELHKMNDQLAADLEYRTIERDTLQGQLTSVTLENAEMNDYIVTAAQTAIEKEEQIAELTEDLNTTYFVVGEYKALKQLNVVEKEGGVIGLGTTKTLKDDFSKESFTSIDKNSYKTIPVFSKKAELATNHPEDSYVWVEGEDGVQWLEITKPEAFWESSKYLVILTNDGFDFKKAA